MTRTEQLRKLMWDNNLTAANVGEIVGRSAQTVRVWRCKNNERVIPEHALKVLQYYLAL